MIYGMIYKRLILFRVKNLDVQHIMSISSVEIFDLDSENFTSVLSRCVAMICT